jgi:hypothetical protein
VVRLVNRISKQFEVAIGVVLSVAVNVMNHFGWLKEATYSFLHDQPVLKHVTLLGCGWMPWGENAHVVSAFNAPLTPTNAHAGFAARIAWGFRMLSKKLLAAYLANALVRFEKLLLPVGRRTLLGAARALLRKESLEGLVAMSASQFKKPRTVPLIHELHFTRNELR